MAFWQKKTEEYEEMSQLIGHNEGIRQATVAQKLGVAKSTVQRRLASMEEAGILLSEDDKGGLWVFGKRE